MNFVKLEEKGKKIFAKFPKVRRFCKGIYQRVSYILSHEKTKSEGKLERISPKDDYEYFYGYYDKSPWDKNDRYIIALKVKKANKVPDSVEEANIVVFDTKNNNKVYEIGKTHCWNTQQGCMAQWIGPDFENKIIYNDFRNGKYVSVIYNFVEKKEEKVFDMPIYDVSKDGKYALTLDFSRLHRLRKGYGYANVEEITKRELCPDKTCIWKIDLNTGNITSVVKYTDLANFETRKEMNGAEHKVNHIMISPNGERFMVLHRWFKHNEKFTRLVTMNVDGSDMYNLSDDNFVSHCCWKNNNEILSFLRKKETGNHYYLMKDKSKEYKMYWEKLNTDGHCTYSFDGKYIITDTYPNRKRVASVYLCDEQNSLKRVAQVFAPFKYDNDVRCDLHPRWNHNGTKICIDSVHEGKKELYVIDISEEVKNIDENDEKKVTVLMSTYNGERFLKEQIDSVLNQKGVSVNLIVRDDESTDNTCKILEEYKKNNRLEWFSNGHKNVQKSFLELVRVAPKSDYYAFCDQDDFWEENKLKIAIKELNKIKDNEKPLLYYSSLKLVDENLKYIGFHEINTNRTPYTNFVISNNAGCTMVFNNSLVSYINKADPEFVLMHDSWIYKLCVSVGGKVYSDSNSYILYRQHGNNVVGLKKGIKGKINNVKKYIFKFQIQKQIENLYKYYKDDMNEEYKELSEQICTYKRSLRCKIKLLKNPKIDFKSKGLNLTYKIKVFLSKL